MAESMRVQRALARAGVASRRAAEELIRAGRVTVNGVRVELGATVDVGRDVLAVDGTPLDAAPEQATWLVLHKPRGYVTTTSDPEGRHTVFELVSRRPGLVYVGRLDYLTEGVLLFTTDGTAAHRLTHPSREIERTYVATVRGDLWSAVRALQQGVELDDGAVPVRHVESRRLGRSYGELEITLTEGRNREVRRLCGALGLEVERLVRTAFGPVKLGSLAPGTTRKLTERERQMIAALVG